jgi:hypothetical protein
MLVGEEFAPPVVLGSLFLKKVIGEFDHVDQRTFA